MTVHKLLQKAEPIFRKIDEAIIYNNDIPCYDDALGLIDSAEPPQEWILELPSKAKSGETYKTIPLDLMELSARRIFNTARITSINNVIINQDKSGWMCATSTITYTCGNTIVLPGIASVPCASIQLLELATPKSSSMAVKNALKQLGGLFGKYLNRSEDQEEMPFEVEEPKLTEESLAVRLASCKTIDDLKSYRLIVYSKGISADIQSLYETLLREIKNKK